MELDHYAVLEVSRLATLPEIRSAYRRKAKSAHPTAGGTDAEFIALRQAHDVLTCPEARAVYDRLLDSRSLTIIPGPPVPSSGQAPSFDHLNAHDKAWAIYEWEKRQPGYGSSARTEKHDHLSAFPWEKYGYPATTPPPPTPEKVTAYRRDGDPAYVATITLKQSYEGLRIHLYRTDKQRCTRCVGQGFMLADGPECTVCEGRGHAGRRSIVGRLIWGDPCINCDGAGRIRVPKDCSECTDGIATIRKETAVDVQRGIADGSKVVVPGSTDMVEIRVLSGDGLTRDGDNLRSVKRLTKTTLRKGIRLEVNGWTVIRGRC